MSDATQTQAAFGQPDVNRSDSRVRVWDRFVRVFHWSLVITFALSYWSAKAGRHELHAWSGYFLAGLIVARLIWGIYGSRYARFSNFVHTPLVVLNYLKSIAAGHPQRYLGHNPAGGLMVIALLATLGFIAFSGLTVRAVIDFDGPLLNLMHAMTDQEAYAALASHAIAVNIILAMLGLHLLGVILASLQHKESLVSAMVTGYKHGEGEIAIGPVINPEDNGRHAPVYSNLVEGNEHI